MSQKTIQIRPAAAVVVLGCLALVAWLIVPTGGRSVQTSNRILCGSNLRQMGQACLLYSNEHHGPYPPTLSAMQEEDIANEVFLCPSCGGTAPTTAPANWVDTHADYIYLGAGLDNTIPPDIIIAHEPLTNHAGEGSNVLFGDGHVEWVDAANLPASFAASDRARQAWEIARAATTRPSVLAK